MGKGASLVGSREEEEDEGAGNLRRSRWNSDFKERRTGLEQETGLSVTEQGRAGVRALAVIRAAGSNV